MMPRIKFFQLPAWLGLATVAGTASLAAPAAPSDPDGVAFFEKKVRPLLAEHCYKCHSRNAERLRGGLYLDTQAGWMNGGDSGEALLPGQPEDSLLIKAVRYEDPDFKMPPKYRLADGEIDILERWVAMGAPDPRTEDTPVAAATTSINIDKGRDFWAFQPPQAGTLPAPSHPDWCRDNLDRFVLQKLDDAGLKPVEDADRRTLIRRLAFDLTGLPPTPEEIQDFVHDTRSDDDALAALVDRLLASPRFGERWARHWLDVVRYAESMGRTRNWPFPQAWRYRDYVIGSFNDDKPYDQFVREQIAGDLLPAATPERADELKVATGFLALGAQDLNERDTAKFKMDVVDEQVDVTGRTFMALTTGCARCHDHKFDPIPTRDYYALAGIFLSTDLRSGYANRKGNNNNYFRPELLLRLSEAPPEKPAPESDPAAERAQNRRRQVIQRQITEKNAQLRRLNQLAKRGNDPKDSSPDPADTRREVNALRREVRALQKELAAVDTAIVVPEHTAMGVAEGNVRDCRIHVRGDTDNLGPSVPRGFLQVLLRDGAAELSEDRSGRLELAEWMTQPDHPLTSRVMVNRIWHHLFGRGLVATVDNFGATGERPTHPELLDHLAVRFSRDGWSVMSMIRSIVLSRTYRLSSRQDQAGQEIDPDNLLLWRMNPRRLEVEALRDAMLAVGGQLDTEPAQGSPVMNARLGEMGRRATTTRWADSDKRSIYLPVVRNDLPGMFEVFDFAEPSSVIGRRDVTTVSTQALFMMNNPFVLEQARRMAQMLSARHPSQVGERVSLAYERAYGRPPSEKEVERALAFVNENGGEGAAWAAFCQALLASAEFRYVQ